MSLTLSANFVEQNNLVLPLAFSPSTNGAALRVISLGSGSLGQVMGSGATGNMVWSLLNAPNWISLDTSVVGQVTLNFNAAQIQANPYQFYVQCLDSVSAAYFPILLEVDEPFTIQESNNLTTITANSYDNTEADILIEGVGLTGVVGGVQFLTPAFLPAGLTAVTGDNNTLKLRVSDPSLQNPAGGLTVFQTSPVASQFTIQAYSPGTIYDSPLRTISKTFTLQSLSAKQGTLDAVVGCTYNSNGTFRLDAVVDYLQGAGISPLTFIWSTSGVAGSVSSGGGVNDTFLIWSPTNPGSITFNLSIQNSAGVVLGSTMIGPIACSNATSWETSAAVKIEANATFIQNFSGVEIAVTLSTPAGELASGEVITIDLSVAGATTLEQVQSSPILSTSTIVLNATNPTATLQVTLPSTSSFREKWYLSAVAANASSNPTRTGFAQIGLISSGAPQLLVGLSGGTAISSTTGATIGPIAVTSTYNGGAVTPTLYELVGAPNGISINTGFLIGTALAVGTFTFQIAVSAPGYARSYVVVTLTITQALAGLTIGSLVSSVSSIADNQNFTVSWGISGNPTSLTLQSDSSQHTTRSVIGTSEALVSDVGNGVFSVYGSSFLGNSYTLPILVISSNVGLQAALPGAATIGLIDDDILQLQLNWQPVTVNGLYSAYSGWNIALQQGTNAAVVTTVTGLESGGTVDSRSYTTQVTLASYSLNMQPLTADVNAATDGTYWINSLAFPAIFSVTDLNFSTISPQLNQPVTITLSSAYQSTNSWSVTYSDGSTTGWMPLTIRSVVKTFPTSGIQAVVIQVQNDYSSSTPPVKLRRQVTQMLVVSDQEFASGSTSSLTSTLGIGGNAGFEIIDAANTALSPTQPYAVVVRALVRDTITNELKLMVATSRYSNASSLLGTAAIDVFPLIGRPRVADLIDIPSLLATTSDTSTVPVAITTTTLPTLVVGKLMTPFSFQAQGGTSTYNWWSNGLPYGLKLTLDGTLSGTPLALGNLSVDISVIDSSQPNFINSATFPLTVGSDLAIATLTVAVAQVMVAYTQQLITQGGIPPYTWSVASGALPLGLSLDADSGEIVGIPVSYNSSTDFSKIFQFTVQVSDAVGAFAYQTYTLTMIPAPLMLGNLDQAVVFAETDFKLDIPIFGGTAPYNITSFKDDGVVGTGLQVVNPDVLSLVAGQNVPPLLITTVSQTVYPQSYPVDILVPLAASGGVAPYQFLVGNSVSTTLPGTVVNGDILFGTPTSDGSYNVSLEVIDSLGSITTSIITITSQQKNVGAYTISPVIINLNGSTNPGSWIVTPISAFPDAIQGQNYTPSTGEFYGFGLYLNGAPYFSQPASNPFPMSAELRSGSLPIGIVLNSGNSFGQSTDFSGITLINYTGGSAPTTLGSNSFELEISNIQTPDNVQVSAVSRESITVSTVPGTTPVTAMAVQQNIVVNLNTTNSWSYPLVAEGSTGPYTFTILPGTTLPAVGLSTLNSQPVLHCTSTAPGTYVLSLEAKSSTGQISTPVSIAVDLVKTATQPVHILSNSIPTSIFSGRTLGITSYFVQSDLASNWSATGLPPGIALSTTSGAKTYLQGTPSTPGNYTFIITATSIAFGTTVSQTFTMQVAARTAQIVATTNKVTVGVDYRAINNLSVLKVVYVGYLSTDVDLPLLTSQNGVVGVPGISNQGQPTTTVVNQTNQGFTMNFDYQDNIVGSDIVTLAYQSVNFGTITMNVQYSSLAATGITSFATISEYAVTGNFAPPVQISGGLTPYNIALTGFSDPRFSALSGNISISTSNFVAGTTIYPCVVNMTITDTSGQVVTTTGTLQLTVTQETYDVIDYLNYVWNVDISAGLAFTSINIPNQTQSIPQLGHAPFQYYVDSITLPENLQGKISVSPTRRVVAMQFNETGVAVSVSDRDANLNPSGSFTVAAISSATAPEPGSYTMTVALRVVDALNITTSSTQTLTLKVN